MAAITSAEHCLWFWSSTLKKDTLKLGWIQRIVDKGNGDSNQREVTSL